MNSVSKQIAGIDVVKFLMALCVVALHVPHMVDDDTSLYPFCFQWVITLAVPFFFACSGYLTARKLKEQLSELEGDAYLMKRVAYLFRLLIVWNLFYLPFTLIDYYNSNVSFSDAIGGIVFSLLAKGNTVIGYVLWYVYALSIVLLLLRYVYNNRFYTVCLALAFVANMIFVRLYADSLQSTPAGTFVYDFCSSALGGGLFFFSGYFVAKLPSRPIVFLLVGLIALALSYLAVVYSIRFNRLIGGFALLCLALSVPSFDKPNLTTYFRKASMWVYFLHPLVLLFLFDYFNVRSLIGLGCSVIVSWIASLIVAEVVMRLARKYPALNKLV